MMFRAEDFFFKFLFLVAEREREREREREKNCLERGFDLDKRIA
jgi:hypothetical protein